MPSPDVSQQRVPTSWYAIRRRAPLAVAAATAASSAGANQAAAAAAEAEILIYGDIGESWWSESVSAAQFVRDIGALDASRITVRINSIGGSVPDGIAIHNAIKRHPAHVTTIADAMALSIASLILCAGDTVQMAENAAIMVHAPWTIAAGNSDDLREAAALLDTWATAMSTSYAAKTGETQAQALARLSDGKDHWFTAAEAQAAGFVDEIVSGAPVAAMAGADLSRFRDVPADLAARVRAVIPSNRAGAPATAATQAAQTSPAPGAPSTMTTPNTSTNQGNTAAADAQAAAIEAARNEGIRAEQQRTADIRAAFAPFAGREGMAELEAQCIATPNIAAADADKRILAALAKGAQPVAGGGVRTVEDEGDKRRTAVVQAILARAGAIGGDGKPVRADGANPYRGQSLYDIARASLVRAGKYRDGMSRMEVVGAAFTQSTSDFPVLMENAIHKALLDAYAIAPDTWSRFCKRGSVGDFRAHNRYRTGSLGNLEIVPEGGEFKNKAIPDGEKSAITAQTKGYIVNLTRQAIINDDLDALTGIPAAMGRAAKRTVEADVYASLALNSGNGPTMNDGNPLFHASHVNIGAAAALSIASIDADRVLMAQQKDPSGNDFLDLRPEILLVPIGLGSAAREINAQEYNDEANKQQRRPNTVRGLYRDIVDSPRLSGTKRYSFASPMQAAALEVAFLDGNDTPFMENENGFDVDGTRWKVRLDYGIAGHDWRGAVMNAGA